MPKPTYPCEKCGKPRHVALDGTPFAVCESCWLFDSRNPIGSQTLPLGNVAQLQLELADRNAEIEALKAEAMNLRHEWAQGYEEWEALKARCQEQLDQLLLQANDLNKCSAEIEALKAERAAGEPCTICGGSGKPASGLPCACGGSGKLWQAEQNIRRECVELRAEVARLEQEKADYNATSERRLALIERYEGLISALDDNQANAYLSAIATLAAEARAIRARQA